MYTDRNFKSKKELKTAVAEYIDAVEFNSKNPDSAEKRRERPVTYFQPDDMGFSKPVTDGRITLEGPHYPQPHRWYANAIVKDSVIVKLI